MSSDTNRKIQCVINVKFLQLILIFNLNPIDLQQKTIIIYEKSLNLRTYDIKEHF